METVKKQRKTKTKKKPIDFWHKQEWVDWAKFYVHGFRQNRLQDRLNDHDWDDITQTAIVHAWNKRKFYQRNRPFKPWLKTVVMNQCRNEIRNRLRFSEKSRASKLKFLFRNPTPIRTKSSIVDRGIEEVRYEPDMIDPRTGCLPVSLDEMSNLKGQDKVVMNLLLEHETPMKVAIHLNGGKRFKRGSTILNRIYVRRNRLREEYKRVLDGKVKI